MFDLENAIVDWRKQMLAAGIKSPVPLAELEIHLRDEIQERMQSGLAAKSAFEMSIRQMGEAGALKTEFAKIGDTISEQLKRLFCVFAGIPNYQLATNMNTSNQNPEPGWATYLKSGALISPAIVLWVGSLVFVMPKLKEICAASGASLPKLVTFALASSDLCKNNLVWGMGLVLTALILLEWRARRWPRYRRMVFGIAAFSVNLIALILITTMMVSAVLVASNLLGHLQPHAQ